ncbi:MAG: valine--tRNA ligase [Candidatus Eremiobacteraeota bacterium]|nr:valine--tRNA ligase [Candidatus Eremiobacteraeota bacterium]
MKKLSLEKVYQPADVENRWYEKWVSDNLFRADSSSRKKPYSIVIPPPNITGSLHLGHALDNTIQDILIRGKKMMGFEALWIPGTDHAGIATQNKVEKQLASEKLTRYDLGREEFVKRVWKWKDEYGSTIIMQLKRLGVSCDWTRERFTLDEVCSRAVREAFVRLYQKGLIYKGQRLINWCPRCLTALSDLEVEHEEKASKLYYLRYNAPEGSQGVVIATTRPETILADTAVCVHPEDERYHALAGKEVVLPLVGRKLPVISDRAVDPAFGTGALKITPAHDPVDFEVGQAHGLPLIVVINEKGIMNEEAGGAYEGLDRFRCREKILEDLEGGGFIEKIEDYTHSVGHCYRCHTVIEPYLSWQWFVKMKELAAPAIEAEKQGRVRFIPEKYSAIYRYWMENIRDWCISRQLWWGHRIPVWTCSDCSHRDAFLSDPVECPSCHGHRLEQETDVLDTWFSSGLWPLSTMGWPQETDDLKFFYPTNVLVTARDIIFLWVARMIMMGLEFRGEVPFRDVYIHATILGKDRRRMSKSLGTGVDPLELIDKYGTDATRFGLIYMTSQGQDIVYTDERIQMSRNFANKIWNAARFCLSHYPESLPSKKPGDFSLSLADRWILSRMNKVVASAGEAFEGYSFDAISMMLYDFFWDDFCDWYIEIVKPLLNEGAAEIERERIVTIFDYVFSRFLRLLHPLMPFITEELWSLFPGREGSISCASWPDADGALIDEGAEKNITMLFDAVRGIRSLRSDVALPPRKKTVIYLHTDSGECARLFDAERALIENLGVLEKLVIVDAREKLPGKAVTTIVDVHQIVLPGEEIDDIAKQIERMEKEAEKVGRDLEGVRRKLANEAFVKNAPEHVVDAEKAREALAMGQREKLMERLAMLKALA